MLWGLVGVAGFSLTLPATRTAVLGLDPLFVARRGSYPFARQELS